MIDLEKENKKLEMKRVTLAKEEMEFKILERMAEIDRLKMNNEIQNKRAEELTLELKEETK